MSANHAIRVATTVLNDFAKNFVVSLNRAAEGYRQRLQEYPKLAQKIEYLASEGWFVSVFHLTFSELDKLSRDDLSGDELVASVEGLYRERFDELVSSICNEYPDRKSIIQAAARAHRENSYELSVPVFFAQADGICSAKIERYLFISGRGNSENLVPVANEKLRELAFKDGLMDLLEHVMWLPMAKVQPVALNRGGRRQIGYSGLNRHAVLHGDSVDYANETNSLKAFSLLSHVGTLLATVEKE